MSLLRHGNFLYLVVILLLFLHQYLAVPGIENLLFLGIVFIIIAVSFFINERRIRSIRRNLNPEDAAKFSTMTTQHGNRIGWLIMPAALLIGIGLYIYNAGKPWISLIAFTAAFACFFIVVHPVEKRQRAEFDSFLISTGCKKQNG